jgi:transposase
MTRRITLQPKSCPRIWVGCDLAKASFEAAIWGHEAFPEMRVKSFLRTKDAAPSFLAWLKEQAPTDASLGLVMEATGTFAEVLAGWLLALEAGLHIAIVNPGRTSAFIRSLGLRNKTDSLDAKALARYGAERNPIAWEQPTQDMSELKDLVRTRLEVVEARVAMNLRLADHAHLAPVARTALTRVIQTLDRQIERLEAAIRSHLAHHKTMKHAVDRLKSIKGVGLLTAVTVLVELGNLTRFVRSRQLSAFAGLSPQRRESGTSIRGQSHLCKQGSARARAVLYMAALTAIRCNPDMKATYDRLVAQGKHPRSARGAVMRKLLVLMRAVLKADQDWVPLIKAA